MNVQDPSSNAAASEGASSESAHSEFIRFTPNQLESRRASLPPLLHVNHKGKILWGSTPALSLLETYCGWTKPTEQLPVPLRRMITCRSCTDGSSSILIDGKQGAFLHVRLVEDNKRLLLLLQERSASTAASAHGLTKREVEVFQWLAAGKSNKDIGTILAISPRTVEKHLERIFQYFGVETRTAAAAEFYRFHPDPLSAFP